MVVIGMMDEGPLQKAALFCFASIFFTNVPIGAGEKLHFEIGAGKENFKWA